MLSENQEILILKRAPQSRWMPDKWGLPGGKIEKNETPKDTAARETLEETAVVVYPENMKLLMTDRRVVFYLAEEYTGKVQIDFEHTDWAWMKQKDLTTYDTIPELGRLFEMALNYDKS